MSEKETVIKCISEMNTILLSKLLDNNSYMNVPKVSFIQGLEKEFKRLRNQGLYRFSKISKGKCKGDCEKLNQCGYSFITDDHQSLELVFKESQGAIVDIRSCSRFINEMDIKVSRKIHLFFGDDEKVGFAPTVKQLGLQEQVVSINDEFNTFINDVTPIETFVKWSNEVAKVYYGIDAVQRLNFKYLDKLEHIVSGNSYIQDVVNLHSSAKRAMIEYRQLNFLKEGDLIDWVLKYNENDLLYGDYFKVNNWEQNSLVLHSLNESVVIDCTGYSDSLLFSEIQPTHYWELFEKYKISDLDFKIKKSKNQSLQYNLKTFLMFNNINYKK